MITSQLLGIDSRIRLIHVGASLALSVALAELVCNEACASNPPEPQVLIEFASADVLAFSPGGDSLAIASRKKLAQDAHYLTTDILVVDPLTGREQAKGQHKGRLRALSFRSSAKSLVIVDGGGVSVWQPGSGSTSSLPIDGRYVAFISSLAVSPNGNLLAAFPPLTLWDFERRAITETESGKATYEGGLAFAPDGKSLAVVNMTDSICLLDSTTGEELASTSTRNLSANCCVFSQDRQHLIVGGAAGIKIWSIEQTDGQLQLREEPPLEHTTIDNVRSVAVTPDGRYLVAAGQSYYASIIDLQQRKQVATTGCDASWIALSADGTTLATAGMDAVRIWKLEELLKPKSIAGQAEANARALVAHPVKDGKPNRLTTLAGPTDLARSLGPHSAAALPVLREALHDPNPNVRLMSVLGLGRLGPSSPAIRELMEALNDENRSVAGMAFKSLHEMNLDAATRTELQQRIAMARSESPKISKRNGKYYYQDFPLEKWISDLGGSPLSLRTQPQSGYEAMQMKELTNIVRLLGEDAIPTMADYFRSEYQGVKLGAIHGLSIFAGDLPDEVLDQLFEATSDQKLASSAIAAIAMDSRERQGLPPQRLVHLLDSEDDSLKLSAASAVLYCDPGYPPAESVLLHYIRGGISLPRWDGSVANSEALTSTANLSARAISMLGSIPDNGIFAIDSLAAIVGSTDQAKVRRDDELRAQAAEALGRMGDAALRTTPVLIQALQDGENEVRAAASRNLPLICRDQVPEGIRAIRDSENPDHRRAAYWALAGYREKAVPFLIESLQKEDVMHRTMALDALLQHGIDEAAIPSIRAIAENDQNEEVRKKAMFILDHYNRDSK